MAWIRARLGEGDRPGRDRRAGPDERPAGADRGGADAGRRRVPGARAALLRPAGGARRDGQPPAPRRSRPWARTSRPRSGPAGPRPWATRRTGPPRATRRASARPRSRRCSPSWTGIAAATPAADAATVIADLEARAAHEREGSAGGVNLLTYHRAKGLEWDAVFLPSLEEGILPIRQAKDDDEALAEERRLLYVGITRARDAPRPLVGGAARDPRPRGAPPAEPLPPGPPAARRARRSRSSPDRRPAERVRRRSDSDDPVFEALRDVAHREGPRGGDAPLRHRPRRDAPGDRGGPSADAWPGCAG